MSVCIHAARKQAGDRRGAQLDFIRNTACVISSKIAFLLRSESKAQFVEEVDLVWGELVVKGTSDMQQASPGGPLCDIKR